MKKFFYSLFAIVLISSQSTFAAGYLATYSIKVSDPAGYVKALDGLMGTNWGKSFPAVVSLHQYVFNGYDDATHVVVLNYDDVSSLCTGTESFSDPVFQSFFAKTSSMAEPVEQSLNMKLISGGNQDADGVGGVDNSRIKPETVKIKNLYNDINLILKYSIKV